MLILFTEIKYKKLMKLKTVSRVILAHFTCLIDKNKICKINHYIETTAVSKLKRVLSDTNSQSHTHSPNPNSSSNIQRMATPRMSESAEATLIGSTSEKSTDDKTHALRYKKKKFHFIKNTLNS